MARRNDRLDRPFSRRDRFVPKIGINQEKFGQASETFARAMGTGEFLIWMTVFVVVWLLWNTLMPRLWQFDPRELNFTLLTMILSLQASYAAPLILLAQNRQADRERVKTEQDRQRAERNLADTEYLAREVVALRQAIEEIATKDFVRDEMKDLLRDLLTELREDGDANGSGKPANSKAANGKAANSKPAGASKSVSSRAHRIAND